MPSTVIPTRGMPHRVEPRAAACRATRAIALLAVLLFTPRPANAQTTPDLEKQAAARALFEEGLAHIEAERFDEAADRFERAYLLRPSAEIAYNLSSALIRKGRLVRASELLRVVAADDRAAEQVGSAARARLDEILPRLGRLTVHLVGAPSDAVVRLDGAVVDPAMLGVAIPVDPGRHTIAATWGTAPPLEKVVVVEEGGRVEASVPVAVPDARRETARAGRSRVWLWTALAAVAAGTAAAIAVTQGQEEPAPRHGTIRVGGR